jgi:outer membrane protein W
MRTPILLFVVLFLSGATMLVAQDFKKLRVGLGGGLALPQGNNGTPGWVASLEPGFRITDNLLICVKAETGMFTRGMSRNVTVVNPTTQLISGSVYLQLYLSSNYVRPFIAGGAGYSMMSDESMRVTFNGVSETILIGKDQTHFLLRAGIELWHVSLTGELTFSGDEKPTDFLEIKNSYLSARLMFFIGGGVH